MSYRLLPFHSHTISLTCKYMSRLLFNSSFPLSTGMVFIVQGTVLHGQQASVLSSVCQWDGATDFRASQVSLHVMKQFYCYNTLIICLIKCTYGSFFLGSLFIWKCIFLLAIQRATWTCNLKIHYGLANLICKVAMKSWISLNNSCFNSEQN